MKSLDLLEKRIVRKMGRAIAAHSMIKEGDRLLVALSGGKDSWAMLNCLELLRRRAPIEFELHAVTIHPGFEAFDVGPIEAYCRENGFIHFVRQSNIQKIVEEKRTPGTSYCSFCSRLRRGVLYGLAKEEGYTKVCLGHHADDLIETLLLNQFYTGEIKSMPPILRAEDGYNVIIRPLCTVFESDIEAYVKAKNFPVVCCGCPVCNYEDAKRRQIKAMLSKMESKHPGIKANILSSLGRVRRGYLMDVTL